MKNENGIKSNINLMEANCGRNTLGVLLAPDGSMEHEFKYLHQKVMKWAGGIRISSIVGQEALHAFNSTIIKTIKYPLLTTTFTKQECRSLVRLA